MSSLRMVAAFSCRLRSGMVKTRQSPILVRHNKFTSECLVSESASLKENVAKDILRTLAPSCAVSLYLQYGFNDGNVNILNCSSDAIMTL